MEASSSRNWAKSPQVFEITHLICSADNSPTSVWSTSEANTFLSSRRRGGEKKHITQEGGQGLCSVKNAHSMKPTWWKRAGLDVLSPTLPRRTQGTRSPGFSTAQCARWFVIHVLATPSTVFLKLRSSNHLHQYHLGSLWKTYVPGLSRKMCWIINLWAGTKTSSFNRLFLRTLGFDIRCPAPWDCLLCSLSGA